MGQKSSLFAKGLRGTMISWLFHVISWEYDGNIIHISWEYDDFMMGILDIKPTYPLVNLQKAIENGPVEIVDFPINSMVDLSIVFC